MSTISTDLRCPTGSTSLMGKLVKLNGTEPKFIEDMYLQLHCRECTKDFRRIRGDDVLRVLHMYTTTGTFSHTLIQFRDGAEKGIDLETQVKIFKLSTEFKRGRT